VPSKVTVILFALPAVIAVNPVPEIVTVSPTTPDVGSNVIFGSTVKSLLRDRADELPPVSKPSVAKRVYVPAGHSGTVKSRVYANDVVVNFVEFSMVPPTAPQYNVTVLPVYST